MNPGVAIGRAVGGFDTLANWSRETASADTSIRLYEERFCRAWDEYVRRHPSSSPFHLTAWKRVVERTFGFEPRYLFVQEDGFIRGVLPLFLVSNVLQGRNLISTPYAVYGGPCADTEELAELLRMAACKMAEEEGVQYLELREQQPIDDSSFKTKNLYVTFDLELPDSVDGLQRGFPRDTRYMIRKAEKHGLQAVVDNQQLDAFYEVYSHSFHNLGTPVYPKRMFRIILEEFGDQCEVTTVWHDEKAIAAVLSFRFRDWILPYFGGSLLEGRHLAANNFMYWEVMKRALETGVRNFDFGRSKLGSGSYTFKTSWNMRERPLPYQFYLVRRRDMPNFSPANPRFKLFISAWKAMPFQLTKMLGPQLVQLFP
ncbi:MAG TPA: FemAB family XrtA/PEP-CTERM system-associated protein [Candidatus Binatia bacterium]|nr:FemAB family XrtA/PEP-CTERM system-associated protein [Candidatus Binatia bacterium]